VTPRVPSGGTSTGPTLPDRLSRDTLAGESEPGEQPPADRARTLRRLERASGALATQAVARMDEQLPWFRAMPADQRSWVMLVAQAGIASWSSGAATPAGRPG
jgi:hypothetical protein